MADLLTLPPPPEAIATMVGIPNAKITPSILATQQGPEGHLGPEAAGAILMLQATFIDEEKAKGFWAAAVPLMELLATAPGFVRRFSFPDGPHFTLIALWRTAADARHFAATPLHRAAVRDLMAERWQHTHFSAIWEVTSNHGRVIFCDGCEAVTKLPADACPKCGDALSDPFAAVS